uniref:Aminotransferase class V domain-containing protein n=2 Tax=Chenopodium quinoa TaxID=63459 RepID=A0A803KSH4_CHEQI
MEEAARYIKRCLGGGEEDAILFCGSGTTAAIKRLQEVMGVAIASTLRSRVLETLRNGERWVVFLGPYEHHSNLLSWRNSLVEVVEIALTKDGGSIDMEALRVQLEHYESTNRPMLGSFSACSNVTGIVSDTRAIARLLHQYGAFACFDFAASGPYVEINTKAGEIDGYDAVFVSPHKFIGGAGSPGILLMSKKLYLLTSSTPSTCGGGTVSYVNGFSEEDTLYSNSVEERENAGTPPITQTIRAALAFWVKEYIGVETIEEQEHNYMARAVAKLGNIKNIVILRNTSLKRLAILSFLVYPATQNRGKQDPGQRKPLNGRFVAKLLNDLFGIQARGGCACAGPYGHYLLNVDKDYSLALRASIQQGYEGVKPAWTRVSFPYYMSKEEFKSVLDAVEFVATYGHQFLALYHFNWRNGDWTYNNRAFDEILHNARNNIKDEVKLASFMQDLKLRAKVVKGTDTNKNTNDKNLTAKYDSYLETAIFIASLLPTKPKQGWIPEELDIDIPFSI